MSDFASAFFPLLIPGRLRVGIMDEAAGPSQDAKRKAKQPQLSCAVPCSNCSRRKCAQLCPHGVKETRRQVLDIKTAEQMQKRLATLESLLAEQGVDLPSGSPEGDSPVSRKRRRGSSDSVDVDAPGQPGLPIKQPYPRYREIQPSGSPPSRHAPISATREYGLPPRPQSGPSRSHPIPTATTNEAHPGYWVKSTPPDYARPAQSHSPVALNLMQQEPSAGRSPVQHSHGTLVIGQAGRSRYLGPTAGTEWLKNQELGTQPALETPSPEHRPAAETAYDRDQRQATEHLLAFPFPLPQGSSTMEMLLSHLPTKDDAEVLMDSYYRYFAWNHDTAPRRFFQPVFDKIYDSVEARAHRQVHPQQLALLFAILAMGTLQNLELPPHDPSADEYLALAKGCLTKGDFLNNNTIAGVQTLIIMAHYLLQVFWAAYAIEILQANCFSRPTSLAPQYIDTAHPVGPSDHPSGSKSYQTLRFELIQLSAR
ncbi:hypothetical protein IAU60_001222 [Kwoniella sp. DSM 27419]